MDRFHNTSENHRCGSATGLAVDMAGKSIELTPEIGELTPAFLEFCRQVESATCRYESEHRIAVVQRIRNDLLQGNVTKEMEIALCFAQNVILDLITQGWKVAVHGSNVFMRPPDFEGEPKDEIKEKIRNTHLIGRDTQLKEKSVQDFIRGMQSRKPRLKGKWHSIYSLMRDGEELAEKLKHVELIDNENEKIEALSTIVSPYLQVVEPDAVCEHTGLRLGDIWRYFRHTWVNEYKSTPGRSVMILIRDAAGANHPVIGIAALGSSVVQHKVRDQWIGWHPETLVGEIVERPDDQIANWLLTSVKRLISDIYLEDLINEKIFAISDIETPTEEVITKLFDEAAIAINEHRKEPQRIKHKTQKNNKIPNNFWREESKTFLYRSKRCKQLAKLFNIRRTFQENGFVDSSQKDFRSIFQTVRMKAAIQQLIRMIKAEHVGVDMLDITVCGAIAPYNILLGGKLICMLLCSPEIVQYYAKRYSNQISIIASAMKGEPVVRKPNLVLLCTTSLYGVGSSQYNRVKIPLHEIGIETGERTESILYKNLGHSHGFGTYHFSRNTIELGSKLNSRRHGGRHVNSIFGEGVNPLMRKIRESLDFVGLNSDGLLRHGNKRVTYGIALAKNFREVLIGRNHQPEYLFTQNDSHDFTSRIGNYWLRRWLLSRIMRPGILAEVSKHTSINFPRSHGAIVPLEIEEETQETDFMFSEQDW